MAVRTADFEASRLESGRNPARKTDFRPEALLSNIGCKPRLQWTWDPSLALAGFVHLHLSKIEHDRAGYRQVGWLKRTCPCSKPVLFGRVSGRGRPALTPAKSTIFAPIVLFLLQVRMLGPMDPRNLSEVSVGWQPQRGSLDGREPPPNSAGCPGAAAPQGRFTKVNAYDTGAK